MKTTCGTIFVTSCQHLLRLVIFFFFFFFFLIFQNQSPAGNVIQLKKNNNKANYIWYSTSCHVYCRHFWKRPSITFNTPFFELYRVKLSKPKDVIFSHKIPLAEGFHHSCNGNILRMV